MPLPHLATKPKLSITKVTKSIPREALLKYQTKSESDPIHLVLTYHPLS